MLTLTKKQKLFLDYITKFIEKNGYAPSIEEIKIHFKLSAKSTVHQHIVSLTEKGFLNKEHYKARAISVVKNMPLSSVPTNNFK